MTDSLETKLPKRKNNRRIFALIITSLISLVIALFTYGLYSFSKNYNTIYNYPENIQSVYDFTGYNSQSKGQLINLNEDTTFYYNKWAVSEKCTDQPNGIVDYSKGFGRSGYPQKAYGTFRWTFKGLDNTKELKFRMGGDIYAGCKVYIDDGSDGNPTFLMSSGTMSKTDIHNSPGAIKWTRDYFTITSTTFNLYLEFSLVEGGYVKGGDIFLKAPDDPKGDSLYLIYGVAGGTAIILLCALSLTVFLATREYKRSLPFFLLTLSMLFAYFITDFMYIIATRIDFFIPPYASLILNFFSILLLLSSLLFLTFSPGSPPKKSEKIVIVSFFIVSIMLFFFFFPQRLFHIAMIPILLCSLYTIYLVISKYAKRNLRMFIPIIIGFFFFMINVVFNFMDIADLVVYSLSAFPSIALLFLGLSSCYYFFGVTKRLNKKAALAEKNAILYERAETKNLLNAINPHLLFNSLTMIESEYHSSLPKGDNAISLLSKNLRASIDSSNKMLIPLGEEIDNISNYAEFNSLRTDSKLEILFDIGFEDFKVPPLSLQVFVENSIRHAKLQEKKDGYIIVKTCLDIDNVIHVEIKDNGCGFDSYNIDTSKHSGIHNAVTRLKIALNANTEIISSPDKGTTIKITFIKRNADEVGINDVY